MIYKNVLPRVLLWMMAVSPVFLTSLSGVEESPGTTRIATWKDDKKGVFMLMFDDCCPTDVSNVYPALKKRNMTGTFYVISGKAKGNAGFWEKEAPQQPFVVYGNHTVSHNGFPDISTAEKEITGCNDFIMQCFPGKNPRLISYGAPGGVKNVISGDEINALLAKNNLVERPPFGGHGGSIAFKTGDEVLKLADKSIVDGKPEYAIFHGVGGDWLSFDLQQFNLLLDGLETRKGDLWITDHISAHQYQTEREGTSVAVSEAGEARIVLEPKSSVDPALYDLPLTLITRVPTAWTECVVKQKDRELKVAAVNGEIRYEAIPGDGAITISLSSK